PLQIALLHRRERAVHHDELDLEAFGEPGELFDLAFAEIGRGPHGGERRDPGFDDLEIDRAREAYGLVEPRRGASLFLRLGGTRLAGPRAQIGTDHHGTPGRRAVRAQPMVRVAATRLQLTLVPSWWRVFGALEQLDRVTRHDGRDRVLVDELGVSIPPQQHTEVIEPGHD